MAWSTCPKCGGHMFEIKENEPSGSAYKVMVFQCTGCGHPFGIMDYFNIGTLLQNQKKDISDLS
ncbi:MAG: hypothetical protein PHE17_18245, partial [Thiothrix sp.]|uniref:hypothetical protein n=1 Tax=Thiothrix sp. TaxID=1032 RepID=UPI002633E8FD